MRVHALTLALLLAGFAVACSSDPFGRTVDHPERSDGLVFDLTVYPYDLLGNPNHYIMCDTPCSTERAANKVQAVIIPVTPGAFDGMTGTQSVRVRVKFDGHCFQPRSICLMDHRPFIYHELGQP